MATIQTDGGVRIAYEVAGDDRGVDVALVHGITESRRTWDPLIDRFAERGYRVITLDLRGHGESGLAPTYDLGSMAADLGAVLAEVGADVPLLVGHSLGGAVVTAFAAGGSCRKVVNVDQPLALAGFKDALAPIEPLLRGGPDEFTTAIDAVFEQMVGPLADAERARVEGLRRASQDVVLGVWDLVLTSDAADLDALVGELAGQITVPYLAIHGIDPGPEYDTWLVERIRHASFEVWGDHGHYPHLVDPDRFVDRVAGFDAE